MARALSQDLRDRVVAATDAGMSCRAPAARFGVGVATAIRWRQLGREHGRAVACKPSGDQRSSKTDIHAGQITAMLAENGDITLAEIQSGLAAQGVHIGIETLWRFFDRRGITRKKDRAHDRARPSRHPETASALIRRQIDLEPERLLFIDETWTATNMTRSHGWCARGERLRMGFPHGHRKTTTLVAGLRMTGMVAPMVLDVPINGDWFEAYVTQVLIPELRPGDVVIMDNLSSHKRASVREKIEAVRAMLRFLPPYSPDFNPIEKAFSRLKAMLRKAGERTVSGLWNLIGMLVDIFKPHECANYFSSCGYDPE